MLSAQGFSRLALVSRLPFSDDVALAAFPSFIFARELGRCFSFGMGRRIRSFHLLVGFVVNSSAVDIAFVVVVAATEIAGEEIACIMVSRLKDFPRSTRCLHHRVEEELFLGRIRISINN